jgi:hypothetical protein
LDTPVRAENTDPVHLTTTAVIHCPQRAPTYATVCDFTAESYAYVNVLVKPLVS